MAEEKNKQPRDFGVASLENFTKSVGVGRNALLTYGISFDGKYFTDPHSNLVLGRLYCVKCPLGAANQPLRERYGIVWLAKELHPKAQMSGNRSADVMYEHVRRVAIECIKNLSEHYEESRDCEVYEYDGYDFIDQRGVVDYRVRHGEESYRVPNLKSLDPTYYISSSLDQPINRPGGDKYWDSVLRRVKYTFHDMLHKLQFVKEAEAACRMFQTPLDKRNLPPDKVIAKITSKLMSKDSLSSQQGSHDAKSNGEKVSRRLKALNIICDKGRLMEETEVVI